MRGGVMRGYFHLSRVHQLQPTAQPHRALLCRVRVPCNAAFLHVQSWSSLGAFCVFVQDESIWLLPSRTCNNVKWCAKSRVKFLTMMKILHAPISFLHRWSTWREFYCPLWASCCLSYAILCLLLLKVFENGWRLQALSVPIFRCWTIGAHLLRNPPRLVSAFST